MKLRFNLDELIPDIARRLANKHRLIEMQPMMWVDPNYKEFYSQTRGPYKTLPDKPVSLIKGVRYVKTNKGHTIFYDSEFLENKPLPWCKAYLKKSLEGYTHQLVLVKRMDLQLHVGHNGVVRFRTHSKGIRCLSLQNLMVLEEKLSREDAVRLFTLSCNQQWLADYLLGTSMGHMRIANNLVRGCSSFQQFINNINPTMHRVSAKKFVGLSFEKIFEIMMLAGKLHNPHDLLENPISYLNEQELSSQKYQMLTDYIRMMNKHGEKAWFSLNMNRILEHHERAVLIELEKAPIVPIHVSPIGYLFKEYFPGAHYELIEDGARLKKESIIQHHCVSSYDHSINQHQCFIISILYQERRYTGEIKIYETAQGEVEIYLNQLKGFGNRDVPDTLRLEINSLVDEFKAQKFKWKDIYRDAEQIELNGKMHIKLVA